MGHSRDGAGNIEEELVREICKMIQEHLIVPESKIAHKKKRKRKKEGI